MKKELKKDIIDYAVVNGVYGIVEVVTTLGMASKRDDICTLSFLGNIVNHVARTSHFALNGIFSKSNTGKVLNLSSAVLSGAYMVTMFDSTFCTDEKFEEKYSR